MRRFTAIVTACLATGLSASAASAGFTANYLGYGNFQSHSVGYSTALAWNSVASVSMFNLKLAEHRWEVGGETVYTWCAQLYQGVTAGNAYAYEAVALEMAPQTPPAPGPMGVAKATLLRDAMSRWLGSDGRVLESAGTAEARTAAFCALAWEIIHENIQTTDAMVGKDRISLQSGAFRAGLTGEAASIFASMVSSLGQGGFQTVAAEGWNSPTVQDQFRLVPSPGSIALLGLAGLCFRRRR
jgi:hypothetical protein